MIRIFRSTGKMPAAVSGRRRRGACRRLPAPLIAALAAGLVVSGCAAPAQNPVTSMAAHRTGNGADVSIGILDEGWHTGLVLPASALDPSLAGVRDRFPGATYLAVGWGNRRFYMAAHPGLEAAASALLPSPSVLFIQGLPARPRMSSRSGAGLHWVCLSRAEVSRLDAYLARYLRKGPAGNPVGLGGGPLPDSRFFASTGTYDAFHTCNTWTVSALAAAGLPVNAGGVVFAGQAMSAVHALPACR